MSSSKWRPLRHGTARDRRRIVVDDRDTCPATTHDGWYCSLKPRHRGNHESWGTDPLELFATWKEARRAQ